MEKDLNYWKKNAEEDYMKVPISVLRYIMELEKAVLPQADVSGSLPLAEQLAKEIGEMTDEEFEKNCKSFRGNDR